jgi:tripartite-type tricarboxylate transporter receptor subunit TctC
MVPPRSRQSPNEDQMRFTPIRIAVLTVLAVSVITATGKAAAAADSVYQNRQLEFVISSAPGGGYDAYARLIARHLPKQLGVRSVVVQNMPGAGGVRATQFLSNTAAKDGLVIGMVTNNVPFTPLYEEREWGFDATKFNWLGSPNRETPVMFVWHTVPVSTIDEARRRQLILGTTGPTSTAAFYGRVLASVLHLNIKAVHGYKGQPEALNAMERGEVEGYASAMWSTMRAGFPQWLAEKKVKILVQYGATPDPEIGEIPFIGDLVTDDGDRALVQVAVAAFGMGRPTLAPPGVPAERVATLRGALWATFHDPAFTAECAKLRFDCENPSRGEELAAIVDRAYGTPRDVLDRLRQINGSVD